MNTLGIDKVFVKTENIYIFDHNWCLYIDAIYYIKEKEKEKIIMSIIM